jgi:hypothetical protein
MVQAVENWCCVSGTIHDLDRKAGNTKADPEQIVLSIRLGEIKPVAGYPALLRMEDADTVSVIARRSQLGKEQPAGQPVTIPVRVAGPDRCFAHPDWTLARGSKMCGAN